MWDPIGAKNEEREKTKRGLRSERGKVGREGFVAAGLVQISDGFMEEERRDREAVRRETRENEMQKE